MNYFDTSCVFGVQLVNIFSNTDRPASGPTSSLYIKMSVIIFKQVSKLPIAIIIEMFKAMTKIVRQH